MNDTHPQARARMIEMVRKKTPEERLEMGCSMFDFSKQLVISSISKGNPDLSMPFLRRELFLRFYGAEFSETQQRAIITHLVNQSS